MIRGCGAPEGSLEVSVAAQGSGSTWADDVARGATPVRFWNVISFGVQSAVGLACLAGYAAWLLEWRLPSWDAAFNQQVDGECTSDQANAIRRCAAPDTHVMWT